VAGRVTIPESAGLLVAIGTLLAMAGKGLKALLRSFHNEHVAPSIASFTTAVAHNTEAIASLTASLTKSQAAQDRGFERLGDIIADHETRITVLEQPTRGPAALRAKRKAS
jgi:CHAD domain-containing protein